VPDEWSVGKLDLDAYLHRIGYDGSGIPGEPGAPSGTTLAALHQAHLAAIPFENLNLILGRGISVDLESIQAKLVYEKRGGYCYEHGQLFGAALERLGFGVDRLLARVGPDEGPMRPRTHLTLRVRADDGIWLADVGFGSSPPGPLSLRRPEGAGGPQDLDGWIYEIVPDEAGQTAPTWKLRELQAGKWATLYRYEDLRVYPADVVMSNHFTATHPGSWFTQLPIVVRRDVGSIRSLLGRAYTVIRPGGVKERRILTDKEFAAALGDVFGLAFTADELDALVAFRVAADS
jgi:N-hydroxyarylamine O-acetyltransferase